MGLHALLRRYLYFILLYLDRTSHEANSVLAALVNICQSFSLIQHNLCIEQIVLVVTFNLCSRELLSNLRRDIVNGGTPQFIKANVRTVFPSKDDSYLSHSIQQRIHLLIFDVVVNDTASVTR
jgi:hypothetical protein